MFDTQSPSFLGHFPHVLQLQMHMVHIGSISGPYRVLDSFAIFQIHLLDGDDDEFPVYGYQYFMEIIRYVSLCWSMLVFIMLVLIICENQYIHMLDMLVLKTHLHHVIVFVGMFAKDSQLGGLRTWMRIPSAAKAI